MKAGEVVVVHLMNPHEKQWGVVLDLNLCGLTIRCLNVETFEDWTRAIANEQEPSLGLATVFFPLARVERITLDERVGEVESMCEAFAHRAGQDVLTYLESNGDLAALRED